MADSKQAPKQSWQVMEDGLTVVQIADMTGFGASSIRQWSTKFDIPFAIDGKRNVYLADGQQMFMRILEMKSQGLNESEIARELIKSGHTIRDSVTRDSDDPAAGQGLEALLEETITRALALQAEQVGKQLEQQTKLAESYGKATYTIGQLEERVGNLQQLLEQKEEQLRLLPTAVQDLESEKREIEFDLRHLRQELTVTTERLSAMTDEKTVMADTQQSLTQQVETLSGRVRELETTHMTVMAEKDSVIDRLKAELETSRAGHRQLAEQNQALQDNHQAQVQGLQAQLQELQQSLEAERAKSWWAKLNKK